MSLSLARIGLRLAVGPIAFIVFQFSFFGSNAEAVEPASVDANVRGKAAEFIDDLAQAKFDKAGMLAAPSVQKQLNPEFLKAVWKQITEQFGSFEKITKQESLNVEKNQVVTLNCDFAKSKLSLVVSIDESSQIMIFWQRFVLKYIQYRPCDATMLKQIN